MPPKATASVKATRPTRAQVTTATAAPEVRTPLPSGYNPFEQPAPLQPSTYMSTSHFKYDDFVSQRRVARRNLHGLAEERFDPEQHVPSARYNESVSARPLTGQFVDEDPEIEAERHANLVEQPPEIQETLRRDLRNQRFIAGIKGPVTRSAQPSADLRRQRTLIKEKATRVREIENEFAAAAVANDPDFFTQLSGYQSIQKRMRQRRDDDAALLALLDREEQDLEKQLDELVGDADGDESENAEQEARRASIEKEKQERREEIEREKAAIIDSQTAAEDDPGLATLDAISASDHVPVITAQEARTLFETNPLATLHQSLRTQFLQLAEAKDLWCTFQALQLQHETHRAHFNIVELVRALAFRGAKYDGCVKLRVKQRLGALIDKKFNASFLDGDHLRGGHEHFMRDRHTNIVVFKFFLVRRTKNNVDVVAPKTAATHGAALDQLTDNAATDINTHLDVNTRHMHLNKPGLYDRDEAFEIDEDDGTDEYGSLHDMKYLEREMMFTMRVVCVEAQLPRDEESEDEEEGNDATGYASMDDNDYVLPADMTPEAEAAEHTVQASVWSINDRASTNSRPSGQTHTSSTRSTGPNAPDHDDDDNNHPEGAERPAAFVHSDDDEDEDELMQHASAVASLESMPVDELVLSLEQAKALVGEWKGPAFMQLVNSHRIGLLCIRSFMFYASTVKK